MRKRDHSFTCFGRKGYVLIAFVIQCRKKLHRQIPDKLLFQLQFSPLKREEFKKEQEPVLCRITFRHWQTI